MSCSLFCGPDSRNLGAVAVVEAQEASPQPFFSPPPALLTPDLMPTRVFYSPFAKGGTGGFFSICYLLCRSLLFFSCSSLRSQVSGLF